ncbi:efflux RND transporter permease subunit [Lysobacter sp. N42]|nr:efflux RND transporter permease subunit [Aliidiomarina sp. B3213]TCZ93414.1 efflux RND transporter permease subunit [Lysobacter sp. N42]
MSEEKGIIAWFTRNKVAANLLMAVIIISGIFAVFAIRKETFPMGESNQITVRVVYPGAAPQEVEQGIIIRIEDAIDDVQGIKEIRSTANEGMATVSIETDTDYDIQEVMDEIQMNVDSISSFPAQIEPPLVYRGRPTTQILWMSLYGDIDERARKLLANDIRDEIRNLPGVSQADVVGTRNYEIAIEISEENLRRYNLTFQQVVQAVRGTSLDVPGGSIRTPNGDILLRAKNQSYVGREFENIVLISRQDGTELTLGEVAEVQDGFVERRFFAEFDGKPSTFIRVNSLGTQNDLAIAETVKSYIERKKSELPQGVQLDYWGDSSYYLKGRLNLMLKNLIFGVVLVLVALSLFLQIRLAFWVMVGIPVCFLGTFAMMNLPMIGVSVNMISLFGFILVLGIVVDDAIIIGESAYTEIEEKGSSDENVIRGAKKVAVPATFGVLTTVVAFLPMLFVDGQMETILQSIAFVVILALLFSLIESKWILPAHISSMKFSKDGQTKQNGFQRMRNGISDGLKRFVESKYKPFARKCVEYRYTTIATFFALMIVMIGLIQSGAVRWVFFPNVPSDMIFSSITMQPGTHESQTISSLRQIESVIRNIDEEYQEEYGQNLISHTAMFLNGDSGGQILVELEKGENREINGFEIVNRWRQRVPELIGVKELNFQASIGPGGGGFDLEFQLSGSDLDELAAAAQELKEVVGGYSGVFDVSDTFGTPQEEIQLTLKPAAESLGLQLQDVATQVRYAFYGAEAQRIPRDDEEVRVMVRYPLAERTSIGNLESMMIRTDDGREIPFREVAEATFADGFSSINRIGGVRSVNVRARVDKSSVEPREVVMDVMMNRLPSILEKYPNVQFGLEGASQDEQEALGSLIFGFILAMFAIYALMAIPLKSYSQPLIIMSVIPFGFIGAVLGHLVLGMSISILSLFGLIALAGVVVNDSLILVDHVNQNKDDKKSIKDVVVDAGGARFRAIVLTSLTTFLGLAPMVVEKSLQAKIVIPMAVSLAFGILFATVITLLLIPCLYVVLDDIARWWRKEPRTVQEID